MIRVSRSVVVRRPPEAVWELVSHVDGYEDFFSGLQRWEPVGEVHGRTGDRYRVHLQVGATQAGGIIQVVRHEPPSMLAWESELGLRMNGRWEVEQAPAGSRLTLTVTYELQGGPVGWLVERVAGRSLARVLRATVLAARRRLEHPGATRHGLGRPGDDPAGLRGGRGRRGGDGMTREQQGDQAVAARVPRVEGTPLPDWASLNEAISRIPGPGGRPLSGRDPEFLRDVLPASWLASTLWFRSEVRGLERVPPDGPVLLVSNHSGGNLTPDSIVLTLAWAAFFGVDRPLHVLAHALVVRAPGLGWFLRKSGVVEAKPDSARLLLDAGSTVLVYPGGDVEVHRPWKDRLKVDFDGRHGWVRLARQAGVPIVPIACHGGQDTYVPLTDGRRIAKFLRLDRSPARLKVMPISLALPWGLNIGDFLGHIPLPAKITIEVQDPVDVTDRTDEEVYDEVTSLLEERIASMHAEQVLPPFR